MKIKTTLFGNKCNINFKNTSCFVNSKLILDNNINSKYQPKNILRMPFALSIMRNCFYTLFHANSLPSSHHFNNIFETIKFFCAFNFITTRNSCGSLCHWIRIVSHNRKQMLFRSRLRRSFSKMLFLTCPTAEIES